MKVLIIDIKRYAEFIAMLKNDSKLKLPVNVALVLDDILDALKPHLEKLLRKQDKINELLSEKAITKDEAQEKILEYLIKEVSLVFDEDLKISIEDIKKIGLLVTYQELVSYNKFLC